SRTHKPRVTLRAPGKHTTPAVVAVVGVTGVNVTLRVGHEVGDRCVAVTQLADVDSRQRSFAQSLEDGWNVYVVVKDADEHQVAASVLRRLQNATDALSPHATVADSQPS
ncbi:unnamed protein product, partial [Ectocarpus sp. 12 AP-2014]